MTSPVTPGSPGAPLVGRVRERAELLAALDDAAGGRGRIVLLAGEPGIGKTRLCEEVEARARARGCAVAWGHNLEEDAPPAWPWVQIIRALSRQHSTIGGELVVESAPFAQAESIAAHVRAVAASRPVLLVMEDLQLASPSMLRLLQLVSLELRDAPVLIVATYRDAELRLAPERAALVGELARRATTVPVRRLDRAAIGELMTEVVGQPLPAGIEAALYERSAGNPLFARELARYLCASDPTMSLALAAVQTLPPAIGDVIWSRVELLSPAARRVVEATSVGGLALAIELVVALTGMARPAALEAIGEAERAGLLRLTDDGVRVAFPHSLVRDAVHRHIALPARVSMREQLAQLEQREQLAPPSAGPVTAPAPVPPPPPAAPAPASLRMELRGTDWIVTWAGVELTARDSKGMRYLAELLAQPDRELHVTLLAARAGGDDVPGPDDAAADRARARLADLAEDLDDAERRNDEGRRLALRAEMEHLAEILEPRAQSARAARPAADVERLRQSITKRVRDAIKRIAERDARLGELLERSIRTGTSCAYEPVAELRQRSGS